MAKEQLFRGYLSTALSLVQQYTGKSPFSLFLKEYFSANKKYGSRDRKYIAHLCYCYFRSGHALKASPPEKKMIDSLFLCSPEGNELLQMLQPVYDEKATLSIENKMALLHPLFVEREVFPWHDELSKGVEIPAFYFSLFIQPFIFGRIRPGYRETVLHKLISRQVSFRELGEDCLAFHNATKLEDAVVINRELVVQDMNSQRVGEFIKQAGLSPSDTVWDCCAASGGKSMMLYDIQPGIKLTVSDIRENILVNLRNRFATAGIAGYKSFVADLSNAAQSPRGAGYQLIIADVPCSGSGTWSRTPEQLYFFDAGKIAGYAALQKKILVNVVGTLAAGGHLLYCTCSVFKKENEEMVEFLQEKYNLERVSMELLTGYEKKADTLFAALLKKKL